MPATPAYHAHVAPGGAWQLRVFNLPPAGCPWLTEMLASRLGDRVQRRAGVEGTLSVARLHGSTQKELIWLQKRLAFHGIPLASRPKPQN